MTVGVQRKRVLVTGGAGFLGSRLVRALLEKECEVRVLDVRYGDLEDVKARRNLEFVGIGHGGLHGGMADSKLVRSAMNGVEIVYHLAVNWDGHSWKHRIRLADLFDVNIRGTLNLLEAASLQKGKAFAVCKQCRSIWRNISDVISRRTSGRSVPSGREKHLSA